VTGVFPATAIRTWAGHAALETVPQLDATAVAAAGDAVTVVDVRARSEWDAGHLPGAVHIPLAELPSRLEELSRDAPLVMQCQSGGRSSVATALLQARGFTNVSNLRGGIEGWREAGLPVELENEAVKA